MIEKLTANTKLGEVSVYTEFHTSVTQSMIHAFEEAILKMKEFNCTVSHVSLGFDNFAVCSKERVRRNYGACKKLVYGKF